MKLPIAFYRIEGGYGVHPRWSDTVRRGKIRAYVDRVLEVEEYQAMSDDELYDLILKELCVDEGCFDYLYKGKRPAEYIERAYYVCPDCGLSEFESDKDTFTCKKCGKTVRYLPDKSLEGVNCEWPFRFTTEWYDYQSEYVCSLDLLSRAEELLYTDKATFSKVKLYDKKYPLDENATVCLYGGKITIKTAETTYEFPFDTLSTVSVLGKNKVNIYHEGELYQLKGDKRFNGVKFVQLFYRYKNIQKGEQDGRFLGL